MLLALFESLEASAAKAWFLDRACFDSKISGLLPCDLVTKLLFWVLYGSPEVCSDVIEASQSNCGLSSALEVSNIKGEDKMREEPYGFGDERGTVRFRR